MDTADHSETDRSHNRDTLSSEVMTEMLRDIQDAMLALDERLVTLEASQEGASVDTRRLALGVADMGDALKRRMRALEQGRPAAPSIEAPERSAAPISPRQPPQHRLPWIAALVFALLVVLGGFWLMAAESLNHASPPAPTRPPVVTPPALSPAPAPAVAKTGPVIPPPLVHTASHSATPPHRWTPFRKTYAHANPASQSTSATTGFGHYGPTPSAPAPATNAAPPHPPS